MFERSLGVLRPDGMIVSAVELAATAKVGAAERRGLFHPLQADAALLAQLAGQVADGALRFTITEIVSAGGLSDAIERVGGRHAPGKIVVDFALSRPGAGR